MVRPATDTSPRRWFHCLAVLAVVVLALQAAWFQSLTADEPYHLVAGEQALTHGRNTLNLEHPPLVKLVAALPLVAARPAPAPPAEVDRALVRSRRLFDEPEVAEAARHGSRLLLTLLFALPFPAAAGWLGAELAGRRAGFVLALLLGLSFPVIPYLPLAQTDAAVSLGYALGLAGGIAWVRRGGWGRLAVAGLGCGLAVAAKFSGVLLLPAVFLLPWLPSAWLPARSPRLRLRERVAATVLLALCTVLPSWGAYAVANRDYDPETGRRTIRLYAENRGTLVVGDRMKPLADDLLALEARAPLAAQWVLGFTGIRIQNELGIYPSYVLGRMDSGGRPWYFPFVLLIKTPLVLLFATGAALVAWWRRRQRARGKEERGEEEEAVGSAPWAVRVGPAVVLALYLGTALTSSYNIGSRHLLPVLPLLYLPAARWVSRRRVRFIAVATLLAAESLLLAPGWIPATNTWFLGEANPTRFALCCSDGAYNQSLLELGRVAERRGLEGLGVMLPGAGEAQIRLHVPGARSVGAGDPLPPGWYAVSILVEEGVPAIEAAAPEDLYQHAAYRRLAAGLGRSWRRIAQGEDHGWVAGTFHLYRLGEGPSPSHPP
jgi:hypothetical protein